MMSVLSPLPWVSIFTSELTIVPSVVGQLLVDLEENRIDVPTSIVTMPSKMKGSTVIKVVVII